MHMSLLFATLNPLPQQRVSAGSDVGLLSGESLRSDALGAADGDAAADMVVQRADSTLQRIQEWAAVCKDGSVESL
jgi:hypothetical protein